VFENLQICLPTDGRRIFPGDIFANIAEHGAILAPADGATPAITVGDELKVKYFEDRPFRTAYFVRMAPVADEEQGIFRAGTVPYRVAVSSFVAAPRLRVDYRNETIRPRTDMEIIGVRALNDGEERTITRRDTLLLRSGISISENLRVNESEGFSIRMIANAKRPASVWHRINLAPRAAAPRSDITAGTARPRLDRVFESKLQLTDARWGGFPSVSQSTRFHVRLKPTARSGRPELADYTTDGQTITRMISGFTGLAASEATQYEITWGVLNPADERPPEMGVTSVRPSVSASISTS
jgi:hypothetical protein